MADKIKAITFKALTAIKGIGKIRAALIMVALKTIKNISDLIKVKGIGIKTLTKLQSAFA